MRKKNRFFLLLISFMAAEFGAGIFPVPNAFGSSVALSEARWPVVLAQFEDAVFSGAVELEKIKSENKKTRDDIEKLEIKVAALRKKTEDGANVIGEIRLKSLLNDLKGKLEENSRLQHQLEEKQKEFEQKALSLIDLYNGRIEGELETTDTAPVLNDLDTKLNLLTALIQKRGRVQYLLGKYRKKNDSEKLLSLSPFNSLKSHDRENLKLALDLFGDRKKDLGDQLEKWSLEEDQLKNELKLQGKMQEFLEDIRQINEDSDIPRGGLKHNDLEGVVGKSQKNKLENRINEIHGKINRGQKTMAQITLLTARVQHQMDSLNERSPQ